MKKIYTSPSVTIALTDFQTLLFTDSIQSGGKGNSNIKPESKIREESPNADANSFYDGYDNW